MGWLLLVLVGCAGSDGDPVQVAERFHAFRIEGNDRGIHELLTDSDRAAVPLEAFPAALPAGLALDLFGWGDTRLDSASMLSVHGDTAAVMLYVMGSPRDTIRLRAVHDPLRLWRFELDRVRWRVSMGLAEQAQLDSLARLLRANPDAPPTTVLEPARAYLEAAQRTPHLTRPADLQAARTTVREATVAEALRVDLKVAPSFTGTRFVEGRVENTSAKRVATLRLIVRDADGAEERVDVWDIPAGGTKPVRQFTRLRDGQLTHRLERIQVF